MLDGEGMIPCLERLLVIMTNNVTLSSDWKTTVDAPIYKRRDKSIFTQYRPVRLTSVVCKQKKIFKSYERFGVENLILIERLGPGNK